MKVALITDTHFGVRNDNLGVMEHQLKFYNEILFPYLNKYNIKDLIHLGDVFDRRKYINYNTLYTFKSQFFDRICEEKIMGYFLVGNHDAHYKNTNEVNSLDLLLREYSYLSKGGYINNYKNATEIELGGCKILLIPWINTDNFKDTFSKVNTTKAHIVFGHLEISGFEMYLNSVPAIGFDRTLFEGFDLVGSGHFHHKSKQDNIQYLGSVYQMNWSDWNDKRGFHIFDTSDHSLEYIENPFKLFQKIYWKDILDKGINNIDYDQFKGSYIKLIVNEKENPYLFDLFIEQLEQVCLNLDIYEEKFEMNNDLIIDQTKSTLDILNLYVDRLDLNVDKKRIKDELFKLYHEALEV